VPTKGPCSNAYESSICPKAQTLGEAAVKNGEHADGTATEAPATPYKRLPTQR